MDYYNILIVILAILCILILGIILSTKKREQFEGDATDPKCNYVVDESDTHRKCLEKCIEHANESSDDDEKNSCLSLNKGCIYKCGSVQDPCTYTSKGLKLTKCNINEFLDISGNNIKQCIDRCRENTKDCVGCHNFTIHDDITKNTVSGNYTHDLNDFKTKCTPHATNHQFCSPCVKHCLECKEPLLCKWIKSPEDQEKLRDEFINEPFFIGVMPENKSALIVWNETRSDISKYLIFVYKKSEVNLNTKDVQQSPLIVKTIERDFKQVGSNSHIIKGLVNGEKYSITVNKVSNHPIPSVKSSNTIDVVPSIVTLVNFSDFNKDNSLKQDMLKSTNFFNNLKNKNFEITI